MPDSAVALTSWYGQYRDNIERVAQALQREGKLTAEQIEALILP